MDAKKKAVADRVLSEAMEDAARGEIAKNCLGRFTQQLHHAGLIVSLQDAAEFLDRLQQVRTQCLLELIIRRSEQDRDALPGEVVQLVKQAQGIPRKRAPAGRTGRRRRKD